jgi:nickel/cobalt transporter (NicO) family protein
VPSPRFGAGSDGMTRLAIVISALAVVAALAGLADHWLMQQPPPPPPRNPFGVGPREAVPAATGISALILEWQARFYREMTSVLRQVTQGPAALPGLLALGFAYGVFHAAGPGHGKAVIAAYILSDDRQAAWRGFALSLGAALMQAAVAILAVSVMTVLLKTTARAMNAATRWVELVSFAAVALIGLAVLWRKALVAARALRGEPVACDVNCAHDLAAEGGRSRSWAETAGVVTAAGLRPCAGAIIVLVFAASQGLFWAGIGATLAMAVGTALTTGSLALLAVLAKRLALGLAGGRGQAAAVTIRLLECLAAAAISLLGVLLLSGLLTSGAAS